MRQSDQVSGEPNKSKIRGRSLCNLTGLEQVFQKDQRGNSLSRCGALIQSVAQRHKAESTANGVFTVNSASL